MFPDHYSTQGQLAESCDTVSMRKWIEASCCFSHLLVFQFFVHKGAALYHKILENRTEYFTFHSFHSNHHKV